MTKDMEAQVESTLQRYKMNTIDALTNDFHTKVQDKMKTAIEQREKNTTTVLRVILYRLTIVEGKLSNELVKYGVYRLTLKSCFS